MYIIGSSSRQFMIIPNGIVHPDQHDGAGLQLHNVGSIWILVTTVQLRKRTPISLLGIRFFHSMIPFGDMFPPITWRQETICTGLGSSSGATIWWIIIRINELLFDSFSWFGHGATSGCRSGLYYSSLTTGIRRCITHGTTLRTSFLLLLFQQFLLSSLLFSLCLFQFSLFPQFSCNASEHGPAASTAPDQGIVYGFAQWSKPNFEITAKYRNNSIFLETAFISHGIGHHTKTNPYTQCNRSEDAQGTL